MLLIKVAFQSVWSRGNEVLVMKIRILLDVMSAYTVGHGYRRTIYSCATTLLWLFQAQLLPQRIPYVAEKSKVAAMPAKTVPTPMQPIDISRNVSRNSPGIFVLVVDPAQRINNLKSSTGAALQA